MGATDSKLAIRKGVFRLYEEKVKLNIPVYHEYHQPITLYSIEYCSDRRGVLVSCSYIFYSLLRKKKKKKKNTNINNIRLQFWTLPESADDVFSLIGANDIRQLRDSSKQNLETLIDKVIIKKKEACWESITNFVIVNRSWKRWNLF
jgi:hypothetical protein